MELKTCSIILLLIATFCSVSLATTGRSRDSIEINLTKEKLDTEFSQLVTNIFNKSSTEPMADTIKRTPENAAFKLVAYEVTDDAVDVQFKIQRQQLEQELKRLPQQILKAAAASPFATNQVRSPDAEALEEVTLAIDRVDVETMFKVIVASLYDPDSVLPALLSNPKLLAAIAKVPHARAGLGLGGI